MATWHQQQAQRRNPTPLWDKVRWNLVTDPPNEMTTIMSFETKEAAEDTLAKWKANGRGDHSYILPPSGKWQA